MFLLIVCLVVGIISYLKWINGYWKRRGIYQSEPELFFGNARKIFMGKVIFADTILERYRTFKKANLKHGGLYIFTRPVYFPMDPTIIKNIFTKDFHYFINRGTYHSPEDVLSMNLVNLTDDTWKNLRHKLTPTFTSGKMKMMFETLLEKTVGLEKVMTEYADSKDSCDIKDVLGRFTTDIIGSCAFGIECNSLEDPDSLFRKFGKKVFEHKKFRLLLTSMLPWRWLGYLNYKKDGQDITNFFTNLVKNTIKYREANEIFRKDFMHLLLQLKNTGTVSDSEKITDNKTGKPGVAALTENEIIAQCFIFFIAGFETSSTTMTFALFELADNQDIQENLRQEIEQVLQKHNGQLTYDAVMEMPYLDKVVNETLRRYPPVVSLPRVCNKNYQIPDTDLVIEKGVLVHIPVWGLHTDPEYYPNPEVFNPENFNEENKAKRPDFTFLPFGEGPRMCIGMRFGMLQAKVGLISLIRKFNFTLNKKTQVPLTMERSSTILSVKGLRFGMLQSKVGLLTLIRKFKLSLSKKTALPVEMEHGVTVLTVKGGVWLDVKNI